MSEGLCRETGELSCGLLLHGAWLKEVKVEARPCLFLWGERSRATDVLGSISSLELRRRLTAAHRDFAYMGFLTEMTAHLPQKEPAEAAPSLRRVAGLYYLPDEVARVFSLLRPAWNRQAAPAIGLEPAADFTYWDTVQAFVSRGIGASSQQPLPSWTEAMPDSACCFRPYGSAAAWSAPPDRESWLRSFIRAMQPAASSGAADCTAAQSEFRTCLRLVAPDTQDGPWRLSYWLHPVDDPSLLLPAAALGELAGDPGGYCREHVAVLAAQLLRDLDRAAAFCPPLAALLAVQRKDGLPPDCALSSAEARLFLSEQVEPIRNSGLSVAVPNWWRKDRAALSVRLGVETTGKNFSGRSFLGLDALAEYRMEVALDGQALSREELERMAALKTPLILQAGEWYEIEPEQIDAALALLDRCARGEIPLGRLIAAAAAGDTELLEPDSPVSLPVTELAGLAGWGELAGLLTASAETVGAACRETASELTDPPGFQGMLRPYQARGVAWLAQLSALGLGACLADDMGLGKTVQVIAYLLAKRAKDPQARPALIVCPLSVVDNWRREFVRFAPQLRVFLHHGQDRLSGRRFAENAAARDVVLTTYALAGRDNGDLRSVEWGDIILDEAQNIKNPGAGQTEAVLRLQAPCRLALTGTPIENRLRELWSILQFLNPGYLPSLPVFEEHFAAPIERCRDTQRADQLQRLVRPFVLRRLKTDKAIAPDLPAKQETKVYCLLTREQATLYEAALEVLLPQIAAAPPFQRKALIAALLTRLKQICNHPAHFLKDGSPLSQRSGKLIRLVEMLTELKNAGRRALIFTQYAQMGFLLQKYLGGVFDESVPFLHGGLPKSERDRLVTDFQQSAQAPSFFLLSLKAGGVGLNLTRADTVFHYDRWWNPAVENQATDRVFRIGQTRNVQIYKLIATATLEEKIDDMIEAKKELAEGIIGGEAALGELSDAELGDLLRLREAACRID